MPRTLCVVLRLFVAICIVATLSALAVIASEPAKKVPPDISWRAAVGMGSGWNREQFLAPILDGRHLEGTPRYKVLSLFGNPGYTAVNYPGTTRIDEYRLSAKNDRVFRIDYDHEGNVQYYSVEDGPCDCPICRTDAPAVSLETIQHAGLLRQREFNDGSLTIKKLEKQLGKAGSLDSDQSTVGGMVWFTFSDTWRVADRQDHYFVADGHVPWSTLNIEKPKDSSVLSWSVVTYAPGCLAK